MFKKIKRIKRKHFIMMACAKLAFYAAVALFAKNQFDEIGNKPMKTDSRIQEPATQKVAAKQTAENQKEEFRLPTIKEDIKR